ncbi:hypothetical protein GGR54DRAFT_508346 [Hypoxylon sp. NC1633]|nr:hypothetical protein GGR54DRAFT_508346 [Hypoxylon sp. NC1633]
MDSDKYMLQPCQSEQCEATVLLKAGGPYCNKHTRSEPSSKVNDTTNSATPGRQHPNIYNCHSHRVSQSSGNSTAMAPQEEKPGDAITVKTKLTAPAHASTHTSEKKQLPDKKVARKTTNAATSKPKQSSLIPETRPSLDRSSTGDAASSDQRPLKRPRLSINVDEQEQGTRHYAASFTGSSSTASPVINSAGAEKRRIGSVAPSDFALRPGKAGSTPLEKLTGSKPGEDAKAPTFKSSYKDSPRNVKKRGIPTHGVIDLTGDDPQPPHSSKNREGPAFNASSSRANHLGSSSSLAGSGEGTSVKVQVPPSPRVDRQTESFAIPSRHDQNSVRESTTSSAPRQPQKKYPYTSTSPHHQAPIPPRGVRPGTTVSGPTPINDNAIADHTSVASSAPGPATPSQTPDTNGVRNGPRSESIAQTNNNLEQPNTLGEFIKKSMQKIWAESNATTFKTRGTPVFAPSTQPEPAKATSPTKKPHSVKEPSLSRTPDILESQASKLHPSTQHPQIVGKVAQPTARASQVPKYIDGIHGPNGPPIQTPALSPIIKKRSWKDLSPEERRQVWISKHDAKKFDSYIYGELNEPNRPGSASFGLPYWQQPQRQVRPATYFAHIDPRVHWIQPRSKKWYQEKQAEIRARGTRKSNMGKAAARAASRKLGKYKKPPLLPERVRNNPAWMAANDELDAMAARYHARKRKEYELNRERCEQKGKEKESQAGGSHSNSDDDTRREFCLFNRSA